MACLPAPGAPGPRPRVISSMTNPVTLSLDGSVAVIRIDNPPVNALSPETIDGLSAALAQAAADPAATAIVVHAAGRTFIAGADIKGLENVVWGGDTGAPEMHDLLQRIEQSPKPVVMAIHGTALGGGVEVAMAGHYRVAVAEAQLGLPEVNLGIIPGAEGTQRLPRLVGVDNALTMVVSGRPIKAAEALQNGLIDRIVDDLVGGAVAFAREVVAARQGPLDHGVHRLEWNGAESSGQRSAAGVYFLKVNAAEFSTVRKLVLLENRSH